MNKKEQAIQSILQFFSADANVFFSGNYLVSNN